MMLDTLLEAVRLKDLDRTGWVRRSIAGPESVAAHSWGVAWLVLALLPDDLDQRRALSYAVLHDLPEVRVGDLTPHDPVSRDEKVRRERAAMLGLTGSSPRGRELAALWEAYEAHDDDEARFVRQLDRLDMALQAVAYAEAQPEHREALVEFVESAARVVDHPVLRPLIDELERRIR
ncbi:MAG: HD domain-containing protein [Myxococcota bacterium]